MDMTNRHQTSTITNQDEMRSMEQLGTENPATSGIAFLLASNPRSKFASRRRFCSEKRKPTATDRVGVTRRTGRDREEKI